MEHTRVVFMGSPEFAIPILSGLAEHYPMVGVITQPDKPAGRGQSLAPPPVKKLAANLGLPLIQPLRLKSPEAMEQLQSWAPDVIVVAAFGQILRQAVLDLPRFGCVNVHASLLPRWRGAAPIQAALAAGDSASGITIMKMDAGIDTGDILRQRTVQITSDDTSITLEERLATCGKQLLLETLPDYLAGKIEPIHQAEENATYAAQLKKEDGLLDFTREASVLALKVRAYHPWPGTYFIFDNQPFKVLRAHAEETNSPIPGKREVIRRFPAIGTSRGWLVLDEVQPAGKKPMGGDIFMCGARNWKEG